MCPEQKGFAAPESWAAGLPGETIAVLGGGPAGAVCALLLARGGAPVALVDCGDRAGRGAVELVSGHARRILGELCGAGLEAGLRCKEIFETVSLWGSSPPVTTHALQNPWGAGIAVDRLALAARLRETAAAAGVVVLEGARARRIERTGPGWRLFIDQQRERRALQVSRLVLATGRAARLSPVSRGEKRTRQIALVAPALGPAGRAEHTLVVESSAAGWWFVLPDPSSGYSAGFLCQRKNLKAHSGPRAEYFLAAMRRTRLIREIFSTYSVEALRGRCADVCTLDRSAGDGWIAIGDAALAPDPMSGKGIEFALVSAAGAAGAWLGSSSAAAARAYENWVHGYAREHARIRDGFLAAMG